MGVNINVSDAQLIELWRNEVNRVDLPDLPADLLLISVMPILESPEAEATGTSSGFVASVCPGALSAPRP